MCLPKDTHGALDFVAVHSEEEHHTKCYAGISILAAVIAAVLLMASAPTLVHSEVGQYPDTPLVVVVEIDEDWVRLEGLKGFDSNKQDHLNQVYSLGQFACQLYNRDAVLLSQSIETENDGTLRRGNKRVYYLLACALP